MDLAITPNELHELRTAMKIIIAILLLAAMHCFGQFDFVDMCGQQLAPAPSATPLAVVTNNLAVLLQANIGVTVSNITQPQTASTVGVARWLDIHNWFNSDGVTNIFSQPFTNAMFSYVTDENGFKCLEEPWAFAGSGTFHPTNYLSCASFTNVDAGAITMFAVADTVDSVDNQSLLYFPSWGFTLMSVPTLGFTQFRVSTLHVPINKAIYVSQQSAGSFCSFQINNTEASTADIASQALNGIEIGGYTAGQPFSGRIYAILIYRQVLSAAQIQTNINALASYFNVVTNYNTQIYCVGDSITIGIGATNMTSWPFQCYTNRPDLKWYNGGFGGITIGTNGDSTGASMYGNISAYYQPTVDATLTNLVFVKAGVNDLNSVAGLTGFECFGRATNYAAALKTAGANKVFIATIANELAGAGGNSTSGTTLVDYNGNIRSNAVSSGAFSGMSDSGLNATNGETRLNDASNPMYFYDGLHLVAAGYQVVASHYIQQVK